MPPPAKTTGSTRPFATRRSAVLGTAAVGATLMLPVAQASSAAASTVSPLSARALTRKAHQGDRGAYPIPKQHLSKLPDTKTRHVLSRFTGGVNAQRLADVSASGGIDAWFEKQLTPGTIPDKQAAALRSWFPSLAWTPLEKWNAYKSGTETNTAMMHDLANWIMLRRLTSKRAVQEMMVDFWSNLLHVASPFEAAWVFRGEYEELIRSHSLGSFDDLLQAVIQHPAMGLYLNNVESTSSAINENLGRELLECHTVGVDGGYTQRDVVNSARILTGFHVDIAKTWVASYEPADHWIGRVHVLGFTSANTNPDGRPVLRKYLSYLANHPATAERICTRLALRFVSDTPSQALIDSLTEIYLASGTQIIPVLRALLASDEFGASALQKVRTPVEDAVATWSLLGVVVAKPQTAQDAANQFVNVSQAIGQVVYDWSTPDAFPDLSPAWMNSGRILASMRIHWMAASESWPNLGITFRNPMDWMPQLPTTFDHVVDYVVRNTLFLECTPTMLQAACVATDLKPTDVIDETNTLVTYNFPRLMVSILDTPEHLSR